MTETPAVERYQCDDECCPWGDDRRPRTTLGEPVDFDLINRREMRIGVGPVNVRTGATIDSTISGP